MQSKNCSNKKIKIFVSTRIDLLNTFFIDNPLYIPIRCGAIRDSKQKNILGDDTGDNISDKSSRYSEFTVQYWIWKNTDADYIGLCHYRRYLAFNKIRFIKPNGHNMYEIPYLNTFFAKRLGLCNYKKLKSEISKYDIVTSEYANVKKMPTPNGFKKTVYEHWVAHDKVLLEARYIDKMMELLQVKYPNLYPYANEYLNGSSHRGFNCFILKRELFQQLCEFEYDILFEMEQRVFGGRNQVKLTRTCAYLGEILYGIYIYYLEQQLQYKEKCLQLTLFLDTQSGDVSAYRSIKSIIYLKLIKLVGYILPVGTKRRKFVKRAWIGIAHRQ